MSRGVAELRDHLAALCAGLTQGVGIDVRVTESDWSFEPTRGVINVSRQHLAERGPEFCAGVLAHEVGHVLISRYHLFSGSQQGQPLLKLLLNSIEDPRVDLWMQRRFPGVVNWYDAVQAYYADLEDDCESLPDFIALTLGCVKEPSQDWTPMGTPRPAVRHALDATREARKTYTETAPAAKAEGAHDERGHAGVYRRSVFPHLIDPAGARADTEHERLVQVSAFEAFTIAEQHIFPEALRVLQADCRALATVLDASADLKRRAAQAASREDSRAALGVVRDARKSAHFDLAGSPGRSVLRLAGTVLILAFDGSRRLIQPSRPWGPGRAPSRASTHVFDGGPDEGAQSQPGTLGEDYREAGPELAEQALASQESGSFYEEQRAGAASQIEVLSAFLDEVFREHHRPQERSGYPSGHRVSLKRLMAFEADPRRYSGLWSRKRTPQQKDPAVSLLIDLSGSMAGDKCDAALKGAILLVEALDRVGIPFAVNGFQDCLIPFVRLGECMTSEVRARIGGMPDEVYGTRMSGNNKPQFNDDGPCVRQAAEALAQWPATDRLLIVISDGQPAGKHSGPSDLEDALAEIDAMPAAPRVVGLGLGKDTRHVEKYYEHAVAEVPPNNLPDELRTIVTTLFD